MVKPLKPCGTHAAAERHRRNNEPLCEACVVAEREHAAKGRERRRARFEAAVVERSMELPDLDEQGILLENLRELRARLQVAPAQSVAGIAREIRGTLDALEPHRANPGSVFDELLARRAARGDDNEGEVSV